MSWKWVIPSFRFQPDNLKEVVDQISAEIPNNYGFSEQVAPKGLDLEEILDALRAIGEAEIERTADRFSTQEVDLVSYGFSQIVDADKAKPVAVKLLLSRWKTRYARSAWEHFQSFYADRYLPALVSRGVSQGSLGRVPEVTANLFDAMESDDPVAYLAEVFLRHLYSFTNLIELYEISPDSPLALELLRQYFLLAHRGVYRVKEASGFIQGALDEIWHQWIDDYRVVIDNYLQMFSSGELEEHDVVLNHALRCLHRPDEPEGRQLWEGISEESRRKFTKWLGWCKVVNFFDRLGRDSQRLEFWRMFKEYLEDAQVRNAGNTKAIFLVFQRIAVIEFLDIGNAAYIYPRAIYERDYESYALGRRPIGAQSLLKDQETSMLRIIHGGSWQNRYYGRVARLIR
ncbi:MAG: hypothetical protein GX977_05220 [Firmicutes bacterium]|jgi:hypothetical protein|nr:hypothetical protein [Bacillota bacterium]